MLRSTRLGAALAVLGMLALLLPAGTAQSAVLHPTVETAPAGLHGFPFSLGCCYYNFGDVGYTLEEYLISGTAKSYQGGDPKAFKTRMIVAKPSNPAKFNGTVLAEWENVTAQVPAEPGWVWMHNYGMAPGRGYGFAAINAQKVGTDFLTKWDPVRYEDLTVPDDVYSFDIFSQAVDALKATTGVKPFGDMTVTQVIGYGQSQSAGRLNTYMSGRTVDAAGVPVTLSAIPQNDADVMDAVIIQADGGTKKRFPDLQIPLVHFETEDGIHSTPIHADTDRDLYRLWEVVGSAHIGNEETQSPGAPTLPITWTAGVPIPWQVDADYWEHSHYGEEGPSSGAACAGSTEMPIRYALNAALETLHQDPDGSSLAQPPRANFDANGVIVRDEFGNATGGLRLPPMRVPVATYKAAVCTLLGSTTPFTPAQLLELYPTHKDYVDQMTTEIDLAVAERIILRVDGDQMMRKVTRSLIPLWRPSSGWGVVL